MNLEFRNKLSTPSKHNMCETWITSNLLFFTLLFFLSSCNNKLNVDKISVEKVEFNSSAESVFVGDEIELTTVITPDNASNKTLYWNSENNDVATVSAFGVVKGKTIGSSTIKVTSEDGGSTALCDITVVAKPIAVTDISLSPLSVDITVGESITLKHAITPNNATNKTVKWKSSDSFVTTVEDGLVKAISVGQSDITVTTEDGEKTATCEVTVLPIRVSSISFSKPAVNLGINEDFTLTYEIIPANAANQNVTWEISNTSIATLKDGYIKAVSEGNVTVTITTEDGNKKATCIVRVYQIINPEINTVDRFATKETKALFRNLIEIQSVGAMFGHHDGLMYGREWYNVEGRSDVFEVCGDYPAVYSLGFETIMDNRSTSSGSQAATAIRRRLILEAYGRGEIITACLHHNNPLTLKDSWDNSNKTVVKEILIEGSVVNIRYKQWLDRLADFANELKDPSGKLIPVILRPYHEHTQSWSWWGNSCTTQTEFINIWRWTIEYLRDVKGVHNFLYAISPQMDGNYGNPGTRNRLLYRWPGDEWVDLLGMDCYHGENPDAYKNNLRTIIDIGIEKGIPVGVCETGIEGIRNKDGEIADYWTVQMLEPLLTVMEEKNRVVCLVVMWRNENSSNPNNYHFFGPYINHSSTDNFVLFYEDPVTIFSGDLPNMYE